MGGPDGSAQKFECTSKLMAILGRRLVTEMEDVRGNQRFGLRVSFLGTQQHGLLDRRVTPSPWNGVHATHV